MKRFLFPVFVLVVLVVLALTAPALAGPPLLGAGTGSYELGPPVGYGNRDVESWTTAGRSTVFGPFTLASTWGEYDEDYSHEFYGDFKLTAADGSTAWGYYSTYDYDDWADGTAEVQFYWWGGPSQDPGRLQAWDGSFWLTMTVTSRAPTTGGGETGQFNWVLEGSLDRWSPLI